MKSFDRWRWAVMGGLLGAVSLPLGACIESADASSSYTDGGAPRDAAVAPGKRRHDATKPAGRGDSLLNVLGDDPSASGVLAGLGGSGSSVECMPAFEAIGRTKAPANTGLLRSVGRSSTRPPSSDQIPECPSYIWAYVGAGHGATPVGNVTAPLSVPATRKERRHDRHGCCYLIPQAPGSPNG